MAPPVCSRQASRLRLPVDVSLCRHVGQLFFPLPLVFFVAGLHGNGEVMTCFHGVATCALAFLRRRPRTWLGSVRLASLRQGEDLLDARRLMIVGRTRVLHRDGEPSLLRGGRLRLGVGMRSGLRLKPGVL